MEMKIATDAAAHAGGRSMSINQTTEDALKTAQEIATLNLVGGKPLQIDIAKDADFGFSVRKNNGFGRYEFDRVDRSAVDSGSKQANSLRLIGSADVPLAVRAIPNFASVAVSAKSVATQVDRDIAIVLDRSGSMLIYKDTTDMYVQLYWLRVKGQISRWDYNNARYYNTYSNNVINRLQGDAQLYAYDKQYNRHRAPRSSRWEQLEQAVDAFLGILDSTDQEEFVSVATFASTAQLEETLTLDYDPIRKLVAETVPDGATAIGQGIEEAVPEIMRGSNARPFAAKTIVILTDGINNGWPDPVDVTRDLVKQYNVTIHTVTFTSGAYQKDMQDVARYGGGKHYHAETGNELVQIFEEIANNLPTILSE